VTTLAGSFVKLGGTPPTFTFWKELVWNDGFSGSARFQVSENKGLTAMYFKRKDLACRVAALGFESSKGRPELLFDGLSLIYRGGGNYATFFRNLFASVPAGFVAFGGVGGLTGFGASAVRGAKRGPR
jgi:hypothetical protein